MQTRKIKVTLKCKYSLDCLGFFEFMLSWFSEFFDGKSLFSRYMRVIGRWTTLLGSLLGWTLPGQLLRLISTSSHCNVSEMSAPFGSHSAGSSLTADRWVSVTPAVRVKSRGSRCWISRNAQASKVWDEVVLEMCGVFGYLCCDCTKEFWSF
mgnify:CR=1 FL=1